MNSQPPHDLLARAKSGDQEARNDLILRFQPFILKVSARFCSRRLDWQNDEELSVAMLAFNEAIDGYNAQHGAAFSSYAYLVINRRLTDYMRKENKYKTRSVSHEDIPEAAYEAAVTNQTDNDFERIFWKEEMNNFSRQLQTYGISLRDLIAASPKHKRVRLKLAGIAHDMSQDPQMADNVKKTCRLPVKEICEKYKVRRKFVETWRRYLLALFLIITDEDLIMVREYVGSLIEEGIGENANS